MQFGEEMQRGGAGLSFASLGQQFGPFGSLAGGGMDALMASQGIGMAPSHYGPLAQQRFVEEMRQQQRMMAMTQQMNSQMLGGRIADITRGFFPGMNSGTYGAISQYSGMIGGFLGLSPPGGFGSQGTEMLHQLSSRYSGVAGMRAYDASQITSAMNDVFALNWANNPNGKARQEAWQRNQRFGAGMSMDQMTSGMMHLRQMGVFQAPTQSMVDESRKWTQELVGNAMGEVAQNRLGNFNKADAAKFVSMTKSAQAQGKTPGEALADAINRMSPSGSKQVTVSDMAAQILNTQTAKDFSKKYGSDLTSIDDPRSTAWKKVIGDQVAPYNQAYRIAEMGGFQGSINDYLNTLKSTFGQSTMMNPNTLQTLTRQIRATSEATGKTFQEVASFIKILQTAPGGGGMSSRELAGITQTSSAFWSEDKMRNLSSGQRNSVQMWSATNSTRFSGSHRGKFAKTVAIMGTAGDSGIIAEINNLSPAEQSAAYSELISSGSYNGQKLSQGMVSLATLGSRGSQVAQAEFGRRTAAASAEEASMTEELRKLEGLENPTTSQKERANVLKTRLNTARAAGTSFSRQVEASSARQLRASGIDMVKGFSFDLGPELSKQFKKEDITSNLYRAAFAVHASASTAEPITHRQALERQFSAEELEKLGPERVNAMAAQLDDIRTNAAKTDEVFTYFGQNLSAVEDRKKNTDSKTQKDIAIALAGTAMDDALFSKEGQRGIINAAGGPAKLLEMLGISLVNSEGGQLTVQQQAIATGKISTVMADMQRFVNATEEYKTLDEALKESDKYIGNRRKDLSVLFNEDMSPEERDAAMKSGTGMRFDQRKLLALNLGRTLEDIGKMSDKDLGEIYKSSGLDPAQFQANMKMYGAEIASEFLSSSGKEKKSANSELRRLTKEAQTKKEGSEALLKYTALNHGFARKDGSPDMEAFYAKNSPIMAEMTKQAHQSPSGGKKSDETATSGAGGGEGGGGKIVISGKVSIVEENGKVVIVHKGTPGSYDSADAPAPTGKD